MGSSLYDVGRACVMFGSRLGEYFEIRKGLRQGWVMFPRLVNIFSEKVVRQVNERAMGKGVKLRGDNEKGWGIKQVLHADGTGLVAEASEHLQHIVNEFERMCDSMGLKINVGKSKVLWL